MLSISTRCVNPRLAHLTNGIIQKQISANREPKRRSAPLNRDNKSSRYLTGKLFEKLTTRGHKQGDEDDLCQDFGCHVPMREPNREASRGSNTLKKTKEELKRMRSEKSDRSMAKDVIGFSFCPGGLLLSYHLGVAKVLKDYGYIPHSTPIAGSSAGSLTAVILGLDMPIEFGVRALYRVEDRCLEEGTKSRLKDYLVEELGEFIEPDTWEVLNDRTGPITVAYYRVWPLPFKSRFVSKFKSNEDLLKCLIASCNIPFYTSDSLAVDCRGESCVDGYFSVSREKFGCPPTGGTRDIKIICFPLDQLQIKNYGNEIISPSLKKDDNCLTEADIKEFFDYIDNGINPTRDTVELLWREHVKNTGRKGLLTKTPSSSPRGGTSPRGNGGGTSRHHNRNNSYNSHNRCSSPRSGGDDSPEAKNNWGTLTTGIFHLAGLSSKGSKSREDESDHLTNMQCSDFINAARARKELPSLPYNIAQLLIIALDHTNDEVLQMCYESGRADAFRWIFREKRDLTSVPYSDNRCFRCLKWAS